MASTTIQIPDDKLTLVLTAFDAEFPGRPVSISQAYWAKMQVMEFIRRTAINYETKKVVPPITNLNLS